MFYTLSHLKIKHKLLDFTSERDSITNEASRSTEFELVIDQVLSSMAHPLLATQQSTSVISYVPNLKHGAVLLNSRAPKRKKKKNSGTPKTISIP